MRLSHILSNPCRDYRYKRLFLEFSRFDEYNLTFTRERPNAETKEPVSCGLQGVNRWVFSDKPGRLNVILGLVEEVGFYEQCTIKDRF